MTKTIEIHRKLPFIAIILLGMIFQYIKLSALPTTVFVEVSAFVYLPYILAFVIIIPFISLSVMLMAILLTVHLVLMIPLHQRVYVTPSKQRNETIRYLPLLNKRRRQFSVMRC